tara:strand:+ start:4387 stop:4515 length:129 start_codon:yes stop_codon:yes gene_type:complete
MNKQDKLAQLQAEADAACHTGDEENYKAIMKEIQELLSNGEE